MTDGSGFLAADLVDETEVAVERSLRPRSLDEYLGQREVKAGLSVLLTAARQRGEAADHVLLHGPPGLGKTTLATIIARELGVTIRYTSGPAIERAGDLAAILTSLDERDILFIDEIHRLNRAVEEILYPAMEDYALDVMIGKGPSARSLRLTLRPFTIVGATTRAGRISGPLRDRFGAVYRLDFYADDDLVAIVRRSARILGHRGRPTTPPWPSPVAAGPRRASSTGSCGASATMPRSTATAGSAWRPWRRRWASWRSMPSASTPPIAGCSRRSSRSSAAAPSGSRRSARFSPRRSETVEDVYEPFLLRIGFLDRTPQGRVATDRARAHLAALGYEVPPRRAEREPSLWEAALADGVAAPSGEQDGPEDALDVTPPGPEA